MVSGAWVSGGSQLSSSKAIRLREPDGTIRGGFVSGKLFRRRKRPLVRGTRVLGVQKCRWQAHDNSTRELPESHCLRQTLILFFCYSGNLCSPRMEKRAS